MSLLLDTNAVSMWSDVPRWRAGGKPVPVEVERVHQRVSELETITFSIITVWEIDRGLLHAGNAAARRNFETMLTKVIVVPADEAVFLGASEVWANAKRAGITPGDMDALIVATARRWGYGVVTHDEGVKACAAVQSPPVPAVDWTQETP